MLSSVSYMPRLLPLALFVPSFHSLHSFLPSDSSFLLSSSSSLLTCQCLSPFPRQPPPPPPAPHPPHHTPAGQTCPSNDHCRFGTRAGVNMLHLHNNCLHSRRTVTSFPHSRLVLFLHWSRNLQRLLFTTLNIFCLYLLLRMRCNAFMKCV